jgi:hypothetical protein
LKVSLPVNLIANLDLDFSLGKVGDYATLAIKPNDALRNIRDQQLRDAAAPYV